MPHTNHITDEAQLGLVMDLQAAWERGDDLQRKLDAAHMVLADREAELLKLKGPCHWAERGCLLHYAHRGPCNIPALAQTVRW